MTADHGEAFFEHGVPLHTNLCDEVWHVPLIIRAPPGSRGKRVPEVVSLIDLIPTLTELTEIPIGHPIQGNSLADVIVGSASPPQAVSFAVMDQISTIRSGELKFILTRPGSPSDHEAAEELYDLRSDPGETYNLLEGDDPQLAVGIRSALLEHEARSRALGETLSSGDTSSALTVPEHAIEQLKALGYYAD